MTYVDFGFLFWRLCRFYGRDPQAVLAMPLRLFWSMAGHLERLRADEALAQMDLLLLANPMGGGGEALTDYRNALRERLGTPVRVEQPRSSRADILALMEG